MKTQFENHEISNVFETLNDDQALLFLGLSSACNDLTISVEAIGKIPTSENSYFFYASVSIVRELALLVVEIDKSKFIGQFSNHSKSVFSELQLALSSFEDDSLAKKALKPVRDLTFHYNFGKSKEGSKIRSSLSRFRDKEKLDIGFIPGVENPLGQRYTFADDFRTDVVNQYLTEELVLKISALVVNLGCLVDSLVTDLLKARK